MAAAAPGHRPPGHQAKLGRLKKRSEFLAVAAANRRWAAPGLVLQARKAAEADRTAEPLRIGFTATKKIGNAVARNRARRRLRAAVDDVLRREGPVAAGPADLVLIARAGTSDRPYEALKADLRQALDRLGIVR